uniref:Cleavage and polyadenylation specificity factor subunit 6 n=1 Tax=Timema cristinae TaxID=61476 RepID=A0A7R9CAS6_TIMCR|nr:unnamed protein product [Timema cristinae]
MADGVDIDLYADDIEQDFAQGVIKDEFAGDGIDLYDDVIAAPPGGGGDENSQGHVSGAPMANQDGHSPGGANPPYHHIGNNIQPNQLGRRHQLYVGNLTWWTTDQDITEAVISIGVTDFLEVKFFENRANGQSKGFCVITLGSDASMRMCLERLIKKELHGQLPIVTFTTKQALMQPQYGAPPPEHRTDGPPPISEAEFEEIMGRNRTVSSSAIARAVSDAAAGEYASAIETLVTAISLIKQSKVANDDRCKILISSLQDTLHGVENKSYGAARRERSRSRDRERSHRRRRERSRSRDREYRERSRDRERERERERERDRYYVDPYPRERSRSREREREREYRERSREDSSTRQAVRPRVKTPEPPEPAVVLATKSRKMIIPVATMMTVIVSVNVSASERGKLLAVNLSGNVERNENEERRESPPTAVPATKFLNLPFPLPHRIAIYSIIDVNLLITFINFVDSFNLKDNFENCLEKIRNFFQDLKSGTIQTARQQTARQAIKKYLEGWLKLNKRYLVIHELVNQSIYLKKKICEEDEAKHSND